MLAPTAVDLAGSLRAPDQMWYGETLIGNSPMRFALSTVILVLLFGPAWAQALPEFDSLSACYDRVPLGSTDEDGVDACVANEEREAKALRVQYPAIPSAVRRECELYAIRVANGSGSYKALSSCLADKERAKGGLRWR